MKFEPEFNVLTLNKDERTEEVAAFLREHSNWPEYMLPTVDQFGETMKKGEWMSGPVGSKRIEI
jgi:hypothetical protein